MAGVLLERLSKTFPTPNKKGVEALRDVSLAIPEQELLAVVGPSGSGKTTLLRILAGLEEPSSGTLSMIGRIMNGVPAREREVAMVFQDHALYPHMTARENLGFGLKLRKVPREEIEQRVSEAAEFLGLAGLLDRLPKDLSGGERQRVALGRALVLRPRLLLLDEPLSNLDGPLRAQMRREIVRLHRRLRGIMMYVTHDQTEAMSVGARMAVIDRGEIQQVGTPLEVYHTPANLFVAGFIGSPPMNLFAGMIEKDGDSVWFREQAAPKENCVSFRMEGSLASSAAAKAGQKVMFGLRAEHVHECRPEAAERDPAACGPSVEGVVEALEPLGPETHLYLRRAAGLLAARVAPGTRARVGDKLRLSLDVVHGHLFDAADGTRLN